MNGKNPSSFDKLGMNGFFRFQFSNSS